MSDNVSQVNSGFMDLFGFSISPLLANFKKNDPKTFNEQINLIENGQTFLMRLMSPSNRFSIFNLSVKDIQFLIDSGYDFLKPIPFPEKSPSTFIHSSWQYSLKNNNGKLEVSNLSNKNKDLTVNPYIFCDYLYFFNELSSEPLKYLTEHLLKTKPDIVKSFPSNGFLLLNKTIKSRKMNVFQLLLENGFSTQLKMNDVSCEDEAKSIGDIYSQYRTIMADHVKDSLTEEDYLVSYLSSLDWLKKEASNIGKKQFDSSGITYLEYLKKQLPLYNQAEQEEMIATCLYSKDPTILSKVLKIINKTLGSYDPKYYPLWKNLSNTGHHQFLYYFLEKLNLPLNTYHQYPDIKEKNDENIQFNPENSFLYHVLSFLANSHVLIVGNKKGPDARYPQNTKGMRDSKINQILVDKLNVDFLLSKNVHDQKNNWFSTCIHHFGSYFLYFYPFLSAIDSDSTIKDDQLSQLKINEPNNYDKHLLNNTWFAKNKENKHNINYFSENSPQQYRFFNNTPKLISSCYQKDLLDEKQKLDLFTVCIKCLKCSNSEENELPLLMQEIFDDLLSNDKTPWEIFNIEMYKEELKRYPEFVTQLKALQLSLKLTSELPLEKLNASIKKTKI